MPATLPATPDATRATAPASSGSLSALALQGRGEKRVPFSDYETFELQRLFGVYGHDWRAILYHGDFHPKRTNVTLKDKARHLGLV